MKAKAGVIVVGPLYGFWGRPGSNLLRLVSTEVIAYRVCQCRSYVLGDKSVSILRFWVVSVEIMAPVDSQCPSCCCSPELMPL